MKQLGVGLLLVVLLASCSRQELSAELTSQAVGTWSSVGDSVSGAVATFSGDTFLGELDPSLVIQGTKPVAAYIQNKKVVVKSREGTAWQSIGSLRVNASRTVTRLDMAASSSALFVTWQEQNLSTTPPTGNIYVQKRTGTTWTQLGSNLNTDGKFAYAPAIALNKQGVPYVAFGQEAASTAVNSSDLFVKVWQNNAWKTLGGSLHGDSRNLGIDDVKMVIDGAGNPVVAWLEGGADSRADVGIYVRRWNGSSWQFLGGGGSDTFNFSIFDGRLGDLAVAPNGTLYLAYTNNPTLYAPQDDGISNLYVVRWNGSSWLRVGADYLNRNGESASHASLVIDNANRPVILFDENNRGYVQRFRGSGWENLGSRAGSFFLKKTDGSFIRTTDIAVDSAGLPVALWEESKANVSNVYVSKFVP